MKNFLQDMQYRACEKNMDMISQLRLKFIDADFSWLDAQKQYEIPSLEDLIAFAAKGQGIESSRLLSLRIEMALASAYSLLKANNIDISDMYPDFASACAAIADALVNLPDAAKLFNELSDALAAFCGETSFEDEESFYTISSKRYYSQSPVVLPAAEEKDPVE